MSETFIEVRVGDQSYEFYPLDCTPVYGTRIESVCGQAVLCIYRDRTASHVRYWRKFLNGDWLAKR